MEQRYSHEQIEAINLCEEMLKYKDIVSYSLGTCDILSDQQIERDMIMYHHGIIHGVYWCIRLVRNLYNLTDEDIDNA